MTPRDPTPEDLERALRVLQPIRWLVSPVLLDLENIPKDGPALLAGNHNLFGILDVPLLAAEIYARLGIAVRMLGDRIHFKVPVWRTLSERLGGVEASPETCARLLADGQKVMVFPGGAREAAKRKGEKYQLIWGERLGFTRIAIKARCPIVPFSMIGIDDAFDILLDANDLYASPLGPLLRRFHVRGDLLMPIVKGAGLTSLPRFERQYTLFAPPIDTARYEGHYDDLERCHDLRDRVRASIEAGVERLLDERASDPHRALLPRALDALRGRNRTD